MIRLKYTVTMLFIVQILIFSSAVCRADSPLSDPGISNGEKITYNVTLGKDKFPLTQVTVKKTENGGEYYEVTAESTAEDENIKIDRQNMAVVYSRVLRKLPEYTVDRQTTTSKNALASKPDEIGIIDFSGLEQILRGFPFEKTRTLKVKSPQGGDYNLVLVMTDELDVKTVIGIIRCYKIELGLDGFFNAFFPKTFFWFTKEAPHYLVRYEGQTGGPGSPQLTMEVSGYENK